MTFFRFKTKLYPLIAITASLFVIIFGLVAARNENLCWYLLGVLAWLCIFGCFKGVLKMLPAFVVFGGAFAGIAYASAGGDLPRRSPCSTASARSFWALHSLCRLPPSE